MKIERFEDIEAWKEARIPTRIIYDISSNGEFSRDFNLRNQIRSASVSTMSNICEGFDRGSDKDFIKFLVIARASASEVKSQLYVALDCMYVNEKRFEETYEQATKVTSLIDGFIRYLKKPRT